MKRQSLSYFTLVLVTIGAIACSSSGPGKPLVTINSSTITQGDLDFLGDMNPRAKAQLHSEAGRKQILDNLIEQELLYQESRRRGVDKESDVRAKIKLYEKVIVAQALLDKEIDAKAKEYYDAHPEEFGRLGLAHIEVAFDGGSDAKLDMLKHPHSHDMFKPKTKHRSKDDALKLATAIKAELDGGKSFEDVAKAQSDDKATASKGGFLGMVSRHDPRLTRKGYDELIEKAFTMKVSEIAGPIQTDNGYHIIKLTQGLEQQTFEEAKPMIMFKVKNDARKSMMENLRKKAKITYAKESGLAPAPAPATKTPTPSPEPSAEVKEALPASPEAPAATEPASPAAPHTH